MFESATTRLTLFYVALLSIVSLFFSYNWYSVATSQLDNNLEQQTVALNGPRFRQVDRQELDEFLVLRTEEITEAKRAVLGNVVSANIIFLTIAGVGSYFLARKSLRPIEEAHEAQRRFTADASHELRTPIAAMQAEIEVALRGGTLTKKESRELLESNLEELAKLKDLSSNLLLIARQDEDGELTLRPTQIAKIVKDSILRVKKLAAGKKITIKTDIQAAKINANAESLTEMTVALLENAIKYSDEGAEVTVTGKLDGDYTLTVADTGRGIKESDLERIFERFYRADQSRNKAAVDGNGLGLAIAQNIAMRHGTTIEAHSDGAGRGSQFSLKLNLMLKD